MFFSNQEKFYSYFQFAEEAVDQLITEDKLFSVEDVSLLQEIMGDIYAQDSQESEEEFLNVKLINETEVSALKSLVGNGMSMFYFHFTNCLCI